MGGTQEASALLDDLAQHGIDVAGFVICERDRDRALELFNRLEPLCLDRGLELELLAEQIGVYVSEPQEDIRDDPQASEASPRRDYFKIKFVIESALAAVSIVVLSPLFALAGLLVAIGLGSPVIFWQRRIGRNGRPIYIYKFKTMRNPVDKTGRRLDENKRLTPIGRFLRATRLDELPQLYNVMRGDMALIGPRPLLLVDQPAGRTLRLSVAPGLTGWAQIHGGKFVSVEEKNALDEWYVRSASLWLDLAILFRTALIVLTGDRRNEERLAAALARAAEDKQKSGSSQRNGAVFRKMFEEHRAL
ncbi:MAG: sugar transferase [Methylocystis sp.]|nr:sugar transferase [Methylocystis sp.]